LPGGANAAILARAQIQFRHGDRKGAAGAIEELLRREPGNAEVLAALGAILLAGDRPNDALAVYRRAAQAAPHDPNFHLQIASLLHTMGRDAEARKECEAALAFSPGNRDAQALLATIDRGGATH